MQQPHSPHYARRTLVSGCSRLLGSAPQLSSTQRGTLISCAVAVIDCSVQRLAPSPSTAASRSAGDPAITVRGAALTVPPVVLLPPSVVEAPRRRASTSIAVVVSALSATAERQASRRTTTETARRAIARTALAGGSAAAGDRVR